MVFRPPEKTRSTATAEPEHENVSRMHVEKRTRDTKKSHGLGLGIELVDPSTTELDHKHQNLRQEV